MNVEQGITWYLDARYGTLRPASWEKHRMTLNIFARTFAGRDLEDITKDEMRAWREGLVKRDKEGNVIGPLKESSKNKYMDRVKALYVYLNREDRSVVNPADIDPLDEPPARRVRLPAESLGAMLDTARHPRDRAIIATSIELLLRGGEIAELRVGDVQPGALRVMVEKGKGELAEDEMAISGELERLLRSWLHDYRSEVGIVPEDAFLFPGMETLYGSGERSYRLSPAKKIGHPEEIVKLALLNSGYDVPKGTGVHAIRRTCARLLFDHLVTEENVDRALSHVSSLMHHSSRQTTELYLGITGDRVLRNKMVRNGGATPLRLATADHAKATGDGLATARVYNLRPHSV